MIRRGINKDGLARLFWVLFLLTACTTRTMLNIYTVPDGATLAQGLRKGGWNFIPIDASHLGGSGIGHPTITKESAIDKVNQLYPGYLAAPGLLGIGANLGILSCPTDPIFHQPHLVWIVTYEGMMDYYSRPLNANGSLPDNYRSSQMNIVIDAITGSDLMGIEWSL